MKATIIAAIFLIIGMWFGLLIGTSDPIEPVPECPAGMVKVEELIIEGEQWVHCKEAKSSNE